jgi:lysine biosynthesis protein LysW
VNGRTASKFKTRCPECLAAIVLKDVVELGDPVTCPECHTLLEVISLRPLRLDYMDENWEEEWEELDEEWDE